MRALDFRLTGIGPGALHEALRNRRVNRGWSLNKLAVKAGLSRATLASIERGGGSIASLLRVLAVLAPNARRRAPERSYRGEGDKQDRDSRFTPADFMQHIYAAFGPVDLDPCAHRLSPVVAKGSIILEEGGDGLTDPWAGRLVYLNPPYSQLLVWLRRAHDQWRRRNVATVVCLIPVRTDSAWFHDTLSMDADIYLLQGRVKFIDTKGRGQNTPFSLMLLTLGATEEQKDRFAQSVSGRWLQMS
jgi:transcriptional regulator with XRE-family HTH domain